MGEEAEKMAIEWCRVPNSIVQYYRENNVCNHCHDDWSIIVSIRFSCMGIIYIHAYHDPSSWQENWIVHVFYGFYKCICLYSMHMYIEYEGATERIDS